MKFFFSLSSFAFTMLLALFAFAYTAINFPSFMRELLAGATHIRDQIGLLGLSDSYMVWVDILLQANQIVLVGFSIFVRFAIGISSSILGAGRGDSDGVSSEPRAGSPFNRWGQSRPRD